MFDGGGIVTRGATSAAGIISNTYLFEAAVVQNSFVPLGVGKRIESTWNRLLCDTYFDVAAQPVSDLTVRIIQHTFYFIIGRDFQCRITAYAGYPAYLAGV